MASRMQVATFLADKLADGRAEAVQAAAAWLVDRGRGREARYLARDAAAALAERGHVLAYVTTARPMDAAAERTVTDYIKQAAGARTVELVTKIDPALIGGIKIELPSAALDASVQAKLDKFVSGMKGVSFE